MDSKSFPTLPYKPALMEKARPTLSIESQNSLNGDVHAREAILLKHDLAHFLSVLFGVHGGLREENLVLRGLMEDAQLLKGVVPQMMHVLPVSDDAVLHGIGHLEHGPGIRGLFADHDVLEGDAVHVLGLLGPEDRAPDDRWEDGLWEVGAREATLDVLESISFI